MSRPGLFLPALLLAILIAAGGCATSVAPPASPRNPVAVYVADYGRHSSLLLPAGGEYFTEYAFGDWDWFALRRTGLGDGVQALLFSRASTLGRRQLSLQQDVSISGVARAVRADRVLRIKVPRERALALRHHLDTLYDRHLDTVTYELESDMWFVRYEGNYSGFYNCNHQTRDWLEALGCSVRGLAFTSQFELNSSVDDGGAGDPVLADVR